MSDLSLLVQAQGPLQLPAVLEAIFSDPWIGSYQIGFGPPLVSAHATLRQEVRQARDARAKLQVYLRRCIMNGEERRRLAALHRRLLVRRQGPVEAEALDRAASEAIDLRLRLRMPDRPPPDVSAESWMALPWPDDPIAAEARILLRLDDPFGTRWSPSGQDGDGLWVELRVAADAQPLWAEWARHWSRHTGYAVDPRREPTSHARRIEDGRPSM